MRITADTLLSMTEKSFVREYLWTPEQQLAFLTTPNLIREVVPLLRPKAASMDWLHRR
jgi:hypothetical protein